MDNNMLRFVEIRNTYARPKIGELSINEKALAEYEKFCLDLIRDNEKQKEIIDKLKKYIEKWSRYYGLSMSTELSTHFDNILSILEDKEV